MVPHPEISRFVAEQRAEDFAGAAATTSKRRVRARMGHVLVALGTRLAADPQPAGRPEAPAF